MSKGLEKVIYDMRNAPIPTHKDDRELLRRYADEVEGEYVKLLKIDKPRKCPVCNGVTKYHHAIRAVACKSEKCRYIGPAGKTMKEAVDKHNYLCDCAAAGRRLVKAKK